MCKIRGLEVVAAVCRASMYRAAIDLRLRRRAVISMRT